MAEKKWLAVVAGAGRSEPGAVCLAALAASAAAGRVYAAYGGVYIAVTLLWLWKIDGVRLTSWDVAGAAVSLLGMGIIVVGGWRA